jgi:membrane protein implicated in regulation of membrane protease activity
MTDTESRWSIRKLGYLLYPFTAAAVAINLFMIGLMGQAVGLPTLSPVLAIALSIPLGVPATFLVARWVRRLMDEADG